MSGKNRLKDEKSPYLLQHADNPVDWYAWGDEAFEKAKNQDKPVFLSIGYSTCHWCHVMEHESFEDKAVANLMNDAFVSVKVDREERPDIDNIYMTVCQAMTGSGGWPLTIIMTPEKKPFFADTYIPKDGRFGKIGMTELIPQITEVWKNRRDDIEKSAEQTADFLRKSTAGEKGESLTPTVLDKLFDLFAQRYDNTYGGFGNAPKFPSPHNFMFLLRYWKRTGNTKAIEMVEKTLQSMRQGGIYDQIGYGFHRYSTDQRWLVPHFEKMLYDQAMLTMAYTETFQATGNNFYKTTAEEILTYVLRDMSSPEGGFYSAEDADSDGEEGKFYVWSEEEIRNLLDKTETEVFLKVFNTEKSGNFHDEIKAGKTGFNILHLQKPAKEIASELKITEDVLNSIINSSRKKLFKCREKRIYPLKDDKILTDWNGLMISALAKASRVFGEDIYLEAAKRSADFIINKLRKPNGRLLHRWRKGDAAIDAHLDDYAFFIWGLIELYESSFDVKYLKYAIELNNDMIEHFWDSNGGFYFPADDGEVLLTRQKEFYDGAVPSGNSIAMLNLLRLGRIMANEDFENKASDISKSFSKNIDSMPLGYSMLLCGLDFAFGPSYEVVIAGDLNSDDTKQMISALNKEFVPNKIVILKPVEIENPKIVNIAGFTKEQTSINNKATAYVCRNYTCNLPVNDVEVMLELLRVK